MNAPNPYEPPEPSWRKPAGIFFIILLICVWALLVSEVVGRMGNMPVWASVPIYAILGIIWILPLRPILLWMETGRFR